VSHKTQGMTREQFLGIGDPSKERQKTVIGVVKCDRGFVSTETQRFS